TADRSRTTWSKPARESARVSSSWRLVTMSRSPASVMIRVPSRSDDESSNSGTLSLQPDQAGQDRQDAPAPQPGRHSGAVNTDMLFVRAAAIPAARGSGTACGTTLRCWTGMAGSGSVLGSAYDAGTPHSSLRDVVGCAFPFPWRRLTIRPPALTA